MKQCQGMQPETEVGADSEQQRKGAKEVSS